MRDNQVKIGFSYESPHEQHESSSLVTYYPELGDCELLAIGEQLDAFLKLCGYVREGTMIFMESLSEDEYYAIQDFLREYRRQNTELKDKEAKKTEVGEIS